jgi:Predicted membrane protein
MTEVARAGAKGRGTSATEPAVPRWAVPASLALALVGLGLSTYLTIEHFTNPGSLACPVGGAVDCAQVTTSAQSKFLFIPVAVLGIVFFVAMLALCLPTLWRRSDRRLWQARMAVAGLGVLFVIYLIFAELFIIEAFCLWCTAVHLVTFGLFAVVVLATAVADPSPFDRR